MTESHNHEDDELINIRLNKREYDLFREMLEREQAYDWFANWIRSYWVWTVGGGILGLILLAKEFKDYL